ncbi:hypothetical protein MA16_Dca007494 [Dendrobium catenatum]|uniref:RNase H type-1 domain-containing protein n=1 Tax=Dendrobium catenatum TaxID=906689 RepID=A0A2I0WB94_9ASPA|nr:hypothetical protein MA16_Dca007494 [Dendrobium catenatum]
MSMILNPTLDVVDSSLEVEEIAPTEVSSVLADPSNNVLNIVAMDEFQAASEMEIAVEVVAGVNGDGSSSSRLSKPFGSTQGGSQLKQIRTSEIGRNEEAQHDKSASHLEMEVNSREDDDQLGPWIQCNKLRDVLLILDKWGFTLPLVDSLDEVMELLSGLISLNLNLGQIYCYTVYQVWRARNDFKHIRTNRSPLSIAATVLSLLPKHYRTPTLEHWSTTQPFGLPTRTTWCPPGWLKFNVDAALKPFNLAGIGVVVRNHEGVLITAAGRRIEHWDPFQAEVRATAVTQMVIRDWKLDLDGIIIEGDCVNAIGWLQKLQDRKFKGHYNFEGPNFSFLMNFKQVLFRHTLRDNNRPADFCANLVIFGDFVFWGTAEGDIPSTLVSLLQVDCNSG